MEKLQVKSVECPTPIPTSSALWVAAGGRRPHITFRICVSSPVCWMKYRLRSITHLCLLFLVSLS